MEKLNELPFMGAMKEYEKKFPLKTGKEKIVFEKKENGLLKEPSEKKHSTIECLPEKEFKKNKENSYPEGTKQPLKSPRKPKGVNDSLFWQKETEKREFKKKIKKEIYQLQEVQSNLYEVGRRPCFNYQFDVDELKVIPFGDWHYGHNACNLKKIKGELAYIKETGAKVILMGDLLENSSKHSIGAGVFDQTITPMRQLEDVYQLLKPIQNNLLMLLSGNHECLSNDTEVLTKRGWLYYNQLTKADKVFSLNLKTEKGEWVNIKEIHIFDFDGELLRLKSERLDFLFTPNHRILFKSPSNKDNHFRFRQLKDFKNVGTRIAIPISSLNNKKEFEIIDINNHLQKVPYKGKIWCLSVPNENFLIRRNGKFCFTGNSRTYKECGFNPSQILAEKLNVPYAGFEGFVKIKVKKQNYTIYATHGSTGARFLWTKMKAIDDVARYVNADIICYGHTHELASRSLIEKGVKDKKKLLVLTGSFLMDKPDGYTAMKNLPPVKLGVAKIKLFGDRKDIHCSI